MPINVSLRQLEYFIAAGDARSITIASERINISPPSISMAVSHLEKEFGLELFVRHHAQGLSLTPAGEQLLVRAKALVGQAEGLTSLAWELGTQIKGRLAVGCLVTLAPMILPELTHAFSMAYPTVELSAREDNQQRLLADLVSARLGSVITYDLDIPPAVAFEPLVSLPPHVLVSEHHALAGRDEIDLRELEQEPFLLLDLPISAEYFMSLFFAAGFEPRIGYRSGNQEVLRTMVANGQGYALANALPRSDWALDGRRVVRLPLKGHHRAMTLGLARLAEIHPTRVLTTFEEHCRHCISDTYIPGMVAPA